MGFWDTILNAPVVQRVFTPNVTYLGVPGVDEGGNEVFGASGLTRASVVKLWRSQPHLRTVVSYRARNMAQLGLHVYRRDEDGGRTRVNDSLASRVLWHVDGEMTTYDLVYAISGDLDLFDRSYLLLAADSASPTGYTLRRLPPTWVSEVRDNSLRISHYKVALGSMVQPVIIPADRMIRFTGYDPSSVLGCSPAIDALREVLAEQVESARFRAQIWKRGGRVSSVLERPIGAPRWSDNARESFRSDWYSKYTGNGDGAGGTPILDDGMTLKRIDFNAQEQQFVENTKMSLQVVASAFHVEPSMVGQGDGATYSNMKAFRKMLYTETLGPSLKQIQQRLNKSLLPMLGMDPMEYYVEFNLQEKLAGDFEEQAAILSTSTGAPWMTRNEARARQNLPAIEGGDELVTPLNVLVGGQASPQDSGTQNETPDAEDRAKAPAELEVKAGSPKAIDTKTPDMTRQASAQLAKFFKRQGRSVMSRIGAGDAKFWDAERWNKELGTELFSIMSESSLQAAQKALRDHGMDPEAYGMAQTVKYLQTAAQKRAELINEAAEQILTDKVQDEDADPADFYGEQADNRALKIATSAVAFAEAFGTIEAGKQNGAVKKVWVTTSSNPRSSHAAMDGETVGIDEKFSNGLEWPGMFGDADEVANCQCEVDIVFD